MPFASVYVELFFIMTAAFMNQSFAEFGYATMVYFVAIIICSEVTILMVYFRLNRENHKWWWQSFFCAGCIGLYILGYSFIFARSLEMKPDYRGLAQVIYFGEMLLISMGAFLLFGSMGTIAAMLFVCKLFSTVGSQGMGSYEELTGADDIERNDMEAVPP